MAPRTRLNDRFKIRHPIVLAAMDPALGGALAPAVSAAGGLGLIGGGCGDCDVLEAEFAKAGNQRMGCGFITGRWRRTLRFWNWRSPTSRPP